MKKGSKKMNRLDFVNKIYSLCKNLDWIGTATPGEIVQAVSKYRKGKKLVPLSSYKIEVNNGCLYLDGDFILRIEPLIRPMNAFSPEADYYELKCLGDIAD